MRPCALVAAGKFDESRRLSNGSLMDFAHIYPMDAVFDTLDDVPQDVRAASVLGCIFAGCRAASLLGCIFAGCWVASLLGCNLCWVAATPRDTVGVTPGCCVGDLLCQVLCVASHH